MPLTRTRLAAATIASIALGCLIAAGVQLAPRIRLGGAIEGVQWVQAAGSMFWALPVITFALIGAGAGYAIAVTFLPRLRMLWAATVGTGAVLGAAAFVAVGTPVYELADGVAPESLLLAVTAFVVVSCTYLMVSIRGGAATQPAMQAD